MRWPTGTDITYLRQRQGCYSNFYLGVQRGKERTDAPPPLMVGMHYQLTATETYTATNHILTFAAGFLAGTDIKVGMTLSVGTLADPTVWGMARIIQVGTNTIVLEENNISALGHLITGEYIWVDGVYRLYRILPFVDVDNNVKGGAGAYYEEGNSTGTAVGIPGAGIAHPGTDDYDYRPVALMGSPRFAWAGENVDFYGWRSHGRAGNTITHWTWDFDGGICAGPGVGYPGSPSSPIHVSWPTAGEYIASLKVRDNSGNTTNDAYGIRFDEHTAVRPVLVYDRPGEGSNTPYTDFEVNSLSGRYGSGWEARITVYGTADKSEFPDNALVILYAEDWYNDAQRSMGGWYGQEEILFCGYIRAGSVVVDSEKSTVTFEAQTIDQWMREIDVWPVNFIDPGAGPTAWHEFQNMTVEDCLWHLASLHSTLKNVADCFFASDVGAEKLLGCVDLTEASLHDQMSNQLGSCFFGQVTASRQGSVHLFKHKNMLDLIERTWFGPPVYWFTTQDWHSELTVGEERMRNSVAQVDFIGFVYDANRQPQDVFSLAPAHQTHFGRIEKVTGVLLTGTSIATGQTENNTLSGLYLAWKNTRFPQIAIHTFNNRFLEPATLDYFAATLASSDTVRGYTWAMKEFLCTGVSFQIDNEKGIIAADIEGEASTWGPDGVAGEYPYGPPLGPPPNNPGEFWGEWPTGDRPWGGELGGEGEVIYFVDRSSGRLFRTRNGRALVAANVVYEDLGLIGTGSWTYWIALDEFDPLNTAMACGTNGIYKTTNLNDAAPTWAQVDANDFTLGQVMSSPLRQDFWMATSNVWNNGNADITAYWTIDASATPFNSVLLANDAMQSAVNPARLEMSIHDADRAWITWERNDGVVRNARTTDMWASHNVVTGVSKTANWPTNSYHRYTNNPSDWVALWGGGDETEFCTAEWSSCTTGTLNVGGRILRYVGGYRWRDDRYWAFSDSGAPRFHISNDGVNWTLQHSFAGTTRYVCGSKRDPDWFYACQDGATAPLLVSSDRGATWQAQTGNWAALGYNVILQCCAVN